MERLSEQDIIAQEWDAVADTALLKFALRSDDIQAHIRRFAAAVEALVRAECAAKVRAIPRHDWAGGALIDRDEALAALEAQ